MASCRQWAAGARQGAQEREEEEQEEDAAPLVPRPQNTRTIEIDRFIPVGQVDARYFDKPYSVVPRDAVGQESFAVIRDAMSSENVAALARVVLSSRERPMLDVTLTAHFK